MRKPNIVFQMHTVIGRTPITAHYISACALHYDVAALIKKLVWLDAGGVCGGDYGVVFP